MKLELEETVVSFRGAQIPSVEMFSDLIYHFSVCCALFPLKLDLCLVTAFIGVLVKIFYSLDFCTGLDVNMSVILQKKQGIIWDNPLIVVVLKTKYFV